MIWLFASVVLALAVGHKGFRKVALTVGGVAIGLVVLCVLITLMAH
jgi:hypothetical protein